MPHLTLQKAQVAIAGVFAAGEAMGLKPLSAAVLDSGGHLIAFQRQDNASNLRPQIAVAKAAGALALGVSSRTVAEMAVERPTFVSALNGLAPHGVAPAAGGVIIVDDGGRPIGAIGVTGDTSDNDEIAALAALAAAGLTAQT